MKRFAHIPHRGYNLTKVDLLFCVDDYRGKGIVVKFTQITG